MNIPFTQTNNNLLVITGVKISLSLVKVSLPHFKENRLNFTLINNKIIK
jgi:hypothetical protein